MNNKLSSLTSAQYFNKVKNRSDYEAASRSDIGWQTFGEHFPMSFPEHKEIVRMYKQEKRKEKR